LGQFQLIWTGHKEPLSKGFLRYSRKYLYFSMKIPLLLIENTSTFQRKYFYVQKEVP